MHNGFMTMHLLGGMVGVVHSRSMHCISFISLMKVKRKVNNCTFGLYNNGYILLYTLHLD